MFEGQRVHFVINDHLRKSLVRGTGVVIKHVFGKLWRIPPDENALLSGEPVLAHEDGLEEIQI